MKRRVVYLALHVSTLYHLYFSLVYNRRTVVCNVNHVQMDTENNTLPLLFFINIIRLQNVLALHSIVSC